MIPSHLELVEKLGSGTLGMVYKAYDRKRRSSVAVKLIRPLPPEAVWAFQRRLHAFRSLEVPGVAPILESWKEGGEFGYSMPLLTGISLSQVAVQRQDRALSAEAWHGTLLAITDLLNILDDLHRKHFIHQALKPSNILTDSQGNLQIVDFGLGAYGSELGARGELPADPAYAAPEQVFGRRVDLRADLYAAGILLFELLLGQHPFDGEEGEGLRLRHLTAPVPAPTSLNPMLPEVFDDFIARALAKKPNDRYESAKAFGQALLEALGTHRPMQRRTRPEPDSSFRVANPGVAGRNLAVETVRQSLGAFLEGRRTVLLVEGSPGMGKTALLDAAEDWLSTRNCRVFRLVCRNVDKLAYSTVRPLLRELLEQLAALEDPEWARHRQEKQAATKALLGEEDAAKEDDSAEKSPVWQEPPAWWPRRIAEAVRASQQPAAVPRETGRRSLFGRGGHTAENRSSKSSASTTRLRALPSLRIHGNPGEGLRPPESFLAPLRPIEDLIWPEPEERPLDESDRDIFAEIGGVAHELLQRFASHGPVALLLDDCHLADERSRQLWYRLARQILQKEHDTKSPPPLLLVLSLDREAEASSELARKLEKLPGCRQLKLEPMNREELELYLAAVLCEKAPESLVTRILSGSEGNPALAMSYVRWLARSGYLTHRKNWRFVLQIDARPLQQGNELWKFFFRTEIRGLDSASKRLLSAIIRVGGRIPCALLGEILEIPEKEVLDAIERLNRLELTRQEGTVLGLTHASIADLLTPTGKSSLEIGAPGHSEGTPPKGTGDDLPERTVWTLVRRSGGLDPFEADLLGRLALQTERWPVAAELHLELGSWAAATRADETARFHLRWAVLAARRSKTHEGGALEQRAELELGNLLRRVGDLAAAQRSLTRARLLSQQLDDPIAEAKALQQLARLRAQKGEIEVSMETYEQGLQRAEQADDPLWKAIMLKELGRVYHRIQRFEEAVQCFETAADLFADLSKTNLRAQTLSRFGELLQELGRIDRAIEVQKEARQGFRSMGSRIAEAWTLESLSELYSMAGQSGEALHYLDQCRQIRLWLDDTSKEASVLRRIGRLHLAMERVPLALETLRKADELYQQLGSAAAEKAGCLVELSSAHLLGGWISEAERLAKRGFVLFGDQNKKQGIEMARRRQADAWLGSGQIRRAMEAYRRANERLTQLEKAKEEAARARLGLGRAAASLGEWREAQAILREARKEFGALGLKIPEARAREALAKLLLDVGDEREAFAEIKQARRLYKQVGCVPGSARIMGLMGRLLNKHGQTSVARQSFNRSVRQLFESKLVLEALEQLGQLGYVSLESQDYARAIQIFEHVAKRTRAAGCPFLELDARLGNCTALARSGSPDMAAERLAHLEARIDQCENRWLQLQSLLVGAEITAAIAIGSIDRRVQPLEASEASALEESLRQIEDYETQRRAMGLPNLWNDGRRLKNRLLEWLDRASEIAQPLAPPEFDGAEIDDFPSEKLPG